MLDKFTEKAIRAVILSQQEARELHAKEIGTEHLLLGIIKEGTGIPVRVLKAVGIVIDDLKKQINAPSVNKQEPNTANEIKFSNQAIRALKLASKKAKALGYMYVGSEHILIALLSDNNYNSVKILKDLNVDISRVKDTATRITTHRSASRAHPEIQSSKKLLEISKAVQQRLYELPFNISDDDTATLLNNAKSNLTITQNETIGTEHLLLAILQLDNTQLQAILDNEGINTHIIHDKLQDINKDRSLEFMECSYQLTPVAYKALEIAIDESVNLGYGSVKPEHILLGILKENKGIAIEILKSLSINPKSLYNKIIYPIEKQKPPTLSIIKLAQIEAMRLEYNVVGTEHILLGILSMASGLAYQVLSDLGVVLKDARAEVEKITGFGSTDSIKEMSFTPRVKRLLELAWDEAKKFDSRRIESEHLLLAIIKLKDCLAMKVLEKLGVDSVEIKQGILAASTLNNNL